MYENKLKIIAEPSVDELIQTAKSVLGENIYGCLMQFFKGILQAEYDYKIIMSRRAYILFRIFSRIILEEDRTNVPDNIHTDIWVYSMRSNVLERELHNKSVLVVDDIIVHGRALSGLIEYLRENNIKNVAVCVFGTYSRTTAVSDVLKESLQHAEKGTFLSGNNKIIFHNLAYISNALKLLSNVFVELIQRTGCAYSETVDSYRISNSVSTDELKRIYNLSYSGSVRQTWLQERAGVWQEILISSGGFKALTDNESFDSGLFLSSTEYVLREYVCNSKNHFVTPFILLPLVRADMMFEDRTEEHIMKYRYKLFLHDMSGSFIREKAVFESKSDYSGYSFGTDKCDLTVKDIPNDIYAGLDICTAWNDSAYMLKSVLDSMKITSAESLCQALTVYIDHLHRRNNDRALNRYDREKAISIHNMFGLLYNAAVRNNLRLSSYEWGHIMGFLLNMCDNGIARYDTEVYYVNGVCWIDGCITDSDRAYCALFNTDGYADCISCAHMITQGANSMFKGLERLNAFEKKLNEMKLMPDDVDFSKIKDFYEKNGTFEILIRLLNKHRTSGYLMRVIYNM